MLIKQSKLPSEDTPSPQTSRQKQVLFNQHGSHRTCLLSDVPSETLTGITSYLEPPELVSLSGVNRRLYQHIKDDITWHRAYVNQYVKIGPEGDLYEPTKRLMLRRTENSWRNQFISNYNLRRRWEHSRNATITHIPVHSSISSMHLMPLYSLVTSSLQYGVVARSLPLTGKIFRGYLDATGTGTGLGIGNPNAEFSPNVTVCALASDGGTAKILWGFRNGEVAVTTAQRAMDADIRAAKIVRCGVNELHEGAVMCAAWDDTSSMVVVTGGADGNVKLWDAKKVQTLWASDGNAASLVPDACVKVAAAVTQGTVAGAMRSGDIVIWVGFEPEDSLDGPMTGSIAKFQFKYPSQSAGDDDTSHSTHDVTTLRIDIAAHFTTILVAYQDDPYFYRLQINGGNNKIEQAKFGDPSFGPISSIAPFFASDPTESGFIITGNHIGCVSVYPWGRSLSSHNSPVTPVRTFEAHEDGSSVTALAWNGMTLITGSARGTTHVWDALTFERLRTFASPLPRARWRANPQSRTEENVVQILVTPDKQGLVVAVGDRVMAWKAGPVPKAGHRGSSLHKHGSSKKRNKMVSAKYLEHLELHQSIVDSKQAMKEENEHSQWVNRRHKEQRAKLDRLGLDEVEAVEYLMMLSRDEAVERDAALPNLGELNTGDEAVFEGDFDEAPGSSRWVRSGSGIDSFGAAGSSQPSSTSSRPSTSGQSSSVALGSATSNSGPESHTASFLTSDSPSILIPSRRRTMNSNHSPMFNASLSSSTASISPAEGAHLTRQSVASSEDSVRSATSSAWSTPLVKSTSTTPSTAVSQRASASPSSRPNEGANLGESMRGLAIDEEMDDDLRFALELSLVEARSRGEDL